MSGARFGLQGTHNVETQDHSKVGILLVKLLQLMTNTRCQCKNITTLSLIVTTIHTSRRGKRSLSSSLRAFHFVMSGGINNSIYSYR